jgi:hypothetical protein
MLAQPEIQARVSEIGRMPTEREGRSAAKPFGRRGAQGGGGAAAGGVDAELLRLLLRVLRRADRGRGEGGAEGGAEEGAREQGGSAGGAGGAGGAGSTGAGGAGSSSEGSQTEQTGGGAPTTRREGQGLRLRARHVRSLVSHRERQPAGALDQALAAAALAHALLYQGGAGGCTVPQAAETLLRLRYNAHPVNR